MNVRIEDSEMAMALLCGLPDPYDPLISALDAIGTEEDALEFEHVKSRVMQEEQRILMRTSAANHKSETNALVAQSHGFCSHWNLANNSRPRCNYLRAVGNHYPIYQPTKKLRV